MKHKMLIKIITEFNKFFTRIWDTHVHGHTIFKHKKPKRRNVKKKRNKRKREREKERNM